MTLFYSLINAKTWTAKACAIFPVRKYALSLYIPKVLKNKEKIKKIAQVKSIMSLNIHTWVVLTLFGARKTKIMALSREEGQCSLLH